MFLLEGLNDNIIIHKNIDKKNFSIKDNSKEKIINILNKEKDVKFQNKENFIIKYNNEQINNLSYNLAIIYDKRYQYYFSLIKTKQLP